MISVGTARALVLRSAHPLPAERLSLVAANGRVLCAGIRAPFPLPRFPNAAMDGYAVRSAETKRASRASAVRLAIRRGAVFAGSAPPAIPARTAARIMTGGRLPSGLDAVLPREEARLERGALVVTNEVPPRQYVHVKGEDCRAGSLVAPAGKRVDPGLVALLSACGVAEVEAHRSPRVAMVVTGSEIRGSSNGRLLRGQEVFDAHSGFLRAALAEFGLDLAFFSRSRDRAQELTVKVARALDRADLVLVTGGVSVGDRDLVRPVLSSLGVETIFSGVSQKPGRPLHFGRRRETLVFGLPGNPFSLVVCYCLYVRPVLRRMLGLPDPGPEERMATLSRPLSRAGARAEFVRGRMMGRNGSLSVTPVRAEGSHRLYPFRDNDCLIAVPPNSPTRLPRRAKVRIHPLPWSRP